MKSREPVSKIMSSDVISLNLNDSLYDAERLFKENKIRHIPVVKNNDLIGILSLSDLLRISFVEAFGPNEGVVDSTIYSMLDIEQVMAKNPVYVSSNESVKDVAQILSENKFHALPIVDNHVLKGIVTTTDLLKYLLEQY